MKGRLSLRTTECFSACNPVPTTPLSNGTDSEVYATASKINPARPGAVRVHIRSQLRPQTLWLLLLAVSSSFPGAQTSTKRRLFSLFSLFSEWVIRIVAAGSQVLPILFPPRLCVNPHRYFSLLFFFNLSNRPSTDAKPAMMFRCSRTHPR